MGPPQGRVAQLDSLRALAVGGVLYAHLVPAGLFVALPLYALLVQLGAARGGGPLDARVCEGTLSALACFWAVDGAARGFGRLGGRLLDARAVQALGRVSYGIYLFHPFAPGLLAAIAGPALVAPGSAAAILGQLATTLALAAASWRYLERPINAWKDRLPYRGGEAGPGPLAAAAPGGSP